MAEKGQGRRASPQELASSLIEVLVRSRRALGKLSRPVDGTCKAPKVSVGTP